MDLHFCTSCGGRIVPMTNAQYTEKFFEKASKVDDSEQRITACMDCGELLESSDEVKSVQEIDLNTKIQIKDEKNDIQTLPTTNENCLKCGHGKAYWWMRQTRSGDEPPTRFYRCVKCENTWREYS